MSNVTYPITNEEMMQIGTCLRGIDDARDELHLKGSNFEDLAKRLKTESDAIYNLLQEIRMRGGASTMRDAGADTAKGL